MDSAGRMGIGMTYASKTQVSSEKSRMEIEQTLTRYGATHFAYMSDPERAAIGFQAANRRVRFVLPLPDPKSREFTHTPGRDQIRKPAAQREAYNQGVRSRWRSLALCIKAKLEAVESGITTFEDEFLAHTVMPDGRTVSEHTLPMIANAYETGETPPLLSYGGAA